METYANNLIRNLLSPLLSLLEVCSCAIQFGRVNILIEARLNPKLPLVRLKLVPRHIGS